MQGWAQATTLGNLFTETNAVMVAICFAPCCNGLLWPQAHLAIDNPNLSSRKCVTTAPYTFDSRRSHLASQPPAFQPIPVIESVEQANGMGQSAASHEHVHDLVARAVDVEGAGIPLFGDAGRVDGRAGAVEETETQKVRDGHASVLHFPAVEEDAVDDGDEGGEAEEGKHGGPHDAVGGTAEFGLHCEDCAAEGGCCRLGGAVSRDVYVRMGRLDNCIVEGE